MGNDVIPRLGDITRENRKKKDHDKRRHNNNVI